VRWLDVVGEDVVWANADVLEGSGDSVPGFDRGLIVGRGSKELKVRGRPSQVRDLEVGSVLLKELVHRAS